MERRYKERKKERNGKVIQRKKERTAQTDQQEINNK